MHDGLHPFIFMRESNVRNLSRLVDSILATFQYKDSRRNSVSYLINGLMTKCLLTPLNKQEQMKQNTHRDVNKGSSA